MANAAPACHVTLAGGDEFDGQLLSLDAEHFEIETWFAGKLRGRRAGLAHPGLGKRQLAIGSERLHDQRIQHRIMHAH